MPVVALMQKGDKFTDARLDETLAMVNERRVAAGLATAPWSSDPQGQKVQISIINGLRTVLEAAIPYYPNHSVHVGGSLDGASAITYWTKATLLTYLGLGGTDGWGNRNWTNVPPDGRAQDLSDFFSNLYGSQLITGPVYYKEWLNEIILVARALAYLPFSLTTTATERCEGNGGGAGYEAARAAAVAAWNEAPWMPVISGIVRDEMQWTGVGQFADCRSYRGKFTANLTGYTGTSAKVFLLLAPFNGGYGAMQNDGPVAGDGNLHYYADATLGEVYLSALLADYIPAFATDEVGFTYGIRRGWYLSAQGIYAPTFNYT